MDLTLSEAEKKFLLHIARVSIASRLENRSPAFPSPPGAGALVPEAGALVPEAGALDAVFGAFVTLHSKNGALRGCIGNIVGRSVLIETVKEMALASAFQDPRFPPVKAEELPSIHIEISVLSPFRRVSAPEKVIPGVHGIYIRRDRFSGLLLPQVAVERKWNREEFLTQGCFKAGLSGESWKDERTEISVFTALVFSEPP
jgi:AmmeMemoRadiSam system protein A